MASFMHRHVHALDQMTPVNIPYLYFSMFLIIFRAIRLLVFLQTQKKISVSQRTRLQRLALRRDATQLQRRNATSTARLARQLALILLTVTLSTTTSCATCVMRTRDNSNPTTHRSTHSTTLPKVPSPNVDLISSETVKNRQSAPGYPLGFTRQLADVYKHADHAATRKDHEKNKKCRYIDQLDLQHGR